MREKGRVKEPNDTTARKPSSLYTKYSLVYITFHVLYVSDLISAQVTQK